MSEVTPFYRLGPQRVRDNAAKQCQTLPDGWCVRFTPPQKTRDQEAKYHSMFADVAKVCVFNGSKRDAETWKRLLTHAFGQIKRQEGEPLTGGGMVIPSLDGTETVQLGFQTRRFTKKQASEFLEFLNAWGAENGVVWSNESGVMP